MALEAIIGCMLQREKDDEGLKDTRNMEARLTQSLIDRSATLLGQR